MKLSAQEFLGLEHKAITLIGMSGAGKSHISTMLGPDGWHVYSCDDLIGTKYLGAGGDMVALSEFVGQIGNPALGGVLLEDFKHKQQLYYQGECDVLADMGAALAEIKGQSFVNDSSGSLCEVEDESILEAVGRDTLFVYLKVAKDDHQELLARAIEAPKPLYFPPVFFNEHLEKYLSLFNIDGVEAIEPLKFLSWVFPHLFQSRLPKYQKLADQYGVSINVADIRNVSSADEFIQIIARALKQQE